MVKNATTNLVNTTDNNDTTTPLTPGQQLRHAREIKKLTQEMVAKQLFINKQTVIYLEEDNYSKLVAPVYARGYMLSYARLLQIPTEPLMVEFTKLTEQINNDQPPMKILQEITHTHPEKQQKYWPSFVAIIIIIAAVVLWVYNHYQKTNANKSLLTPTSATVTVVPNIDITPTSDASATNNNENKETATPLDIPSK